MSLQHIKDAYQNLLAKVLSGNVRPPRWKLYPFTEALGEFGRSLVHAGLYADLEFDAEVFSAWVDEEIRSDTDTCATRVKASFAIGDEIIIARIMTPPLKTYEVFDLADPPLGFDDLEILASALKRLNPVGYYFLHLASMAHDVIETRPHFLEELADCLELSQPLLHDLALRAANDLYWEARKQLEGAVGGATSLDEEKETSTEKKRGNEKEQSSDRSAVSPSIEPKWWHEQHEIPPGNEFTQQSLRGTKKELSMSFKTKGRPDERRIQKKAENNVIWVIRHAAQDWEIFFRSAKLFEEHQKRFEKWKEMQKPHKAS